MVMRLLDPEQSTPWLHPTEREHPETATIFHIIPISEGTWRKIKAIHPTHITVTGVSGTTKMDEDGIRFDMFMSQVVKIERVQWPGSDVEVTITSEADRERFYNMLPPRMTAAISAAIQNTGELEAGDVKNFGGSSGS